MVPQGSVPVILEVRYNTSGLRCEPRGQKFLRNYRQRLLPHPPLPPHHQNSVLPRPGNWASEQVSGRVLGILLSTIKWQGGGGRKKLNSTRINLHQSLHLQWQDSLRYPMGVWLLGIWAEHVNLAVAYQRKRDFRRLISRIACRVQVFSHGVGVERINILHAACSMI